MAISFIPVRDQARVILGAKESTENKGQVLKRISTGKKVAEPRDNISDYRKISSMRTDLKLYQNAIKDVSLHTSRLETALAVNQLLEEQYDILIEKIKTLDDFKNSIGADQKMDDIDIAYYVSDINGTIDAINNAMTTQFNYENVVGDIKYKSPLIIDAEALAAYNAAVPEDDRTTEGKDAFVKDYVFNWKKQNINFSFNGYNDVLVSLEKFNDINRVYDINGDTTVGLAAVTNKLGKILFATTKEGGTAAGTVTNIYTEKGATIVDDKLGIIDLMEENKQTAHNNYKLILAGITNLENIDNLASVQKTNSESAISTLEDIDVQEEMIVLMQAQILEELSSEALIKIKESSRYVVNLIRA